MKSWSRDTFCLEHSRSCSIADPAPVREVLESHITFDFLKRIAVEHRRGRRLWVGTTNLDARRPVIWDLGRIATVGNT